jgi:hypothetical protein
VLISKIRILNKIDSSSSKTQSNTTILQNSESILTMEMGILTENTKCFVTPEVPILFRFFFEINDDIVQWSAISIIALSIIPILVAGITKNPGYTAAASIIILLVAIIIPLVILFNMDRDLGGSIFLGVVFGILVVGLFLLSLTFKSKSVGNLIIALADAMMGGLFLLFGCSLPWLYWAFSGMIMSVYELIWSRIAKEDKNAEMCLRIAGTLFMAVGIIFLLLLMLIGSIMTLLKIIFPFLNTS